MLASLVQSSKNGSYNYVVSICNSSSNSNETETKELEPPVFDPMTGGLILP